MKKIFSILLAGLLFVSFGFSEEYFTEEIDDRLLDYVAFNSEKDFNSNSTKAIQVLTGLSYTDSTQFLPVFKKCEYVKNPQLSPLIQSRMKHKNYLYTVTYEFYNDNIVIFTVNKKTNDLFYIKMFYIDFKKLEYFDYKNNIKVK